MDIPDSSLRTGLKFCFRKFGTISRTDNCPIVFIAIFIVVYHTAWRIWTELTRVGMLGYMLGD